MTASASLARNDGSERIGAHRRGEFRIRSVRGPSLSTLVERWFDTVAPCPWEAHIGCNPMNRERQAQAPRKPLYTPEERLRRDASPWTLVQGILAPLQFLVFAVSLGLVLRYLVTGQGYPIATASIVLKTVLLYTIMVTGSIWEKQVFGKWLFAEAFFWEDVFSFLVLGLQTAYLIALFAGWGSAREQMFIAVAAYGAYVINAAQFLLKLRAARLEAPRSAVANGARLGGGA